MASRREKSGDVYDPFAEDERPVMDVHDVDKQLFGTMDPTVPIAALRLDGGTQPRESLNADVVEEYAEAMWRGDRFPPVVVFYDGDNYWLVDGFHRVEASKRLSVEKIRAEIKDGTQRDAVLFSLGVNAQHGLRRTNQDKRRAVTTMLSDPEWCQWSVREIARRCHVSPDTVSRRRQEMIEEGLLSESDRESVYVTKHGTVSTMNTQGIVDSSHERAQRNREAQVSSDQQLREDAATPPRRPVSDVPVGQQVEIPDPPLSGNCYQIAEPESGDHATVDNSQPIPPVHQPLHEYKVFMEQLEVVAEATSEIRRIQPAVLEGRLTDDERYNLIRLITDVADWIQGNGTRDSISLIDHLANVSRVLSNER